MYFNEMSVVKGILMAFTTITFAINKAHRPINHLARAFGKSLSQLQPNQSSQI
jgi:hypothetical protein